MRQVNEKEKILICRPKVVPVLRPDEYLERVSSTPVKTLVPGQAMNLSELMQRFERGQRLNIHENFPYGENMTRDKVYEESFDDAPGDDIHDIVDVEAHYRAHESRKADYAARKKKEKEQKSKQAPQEASQDLPPDPSK